LRKTIEILVIRQLPSLLFFLFVSIQAFSQCGTGPCQLCNITANITNIEGGDIIVNSASVSGNVDGGASKEADQLLEVSATNCGGLKISIELDFDWDRGTRNNWIHGVSFRTSPNWLAAQGVIIPANDGWLFQPTITGICSGNTYGAGYYWDPPGTDCASNRSNYNGVDCIPFDTNCEEDFSFLVDGDPSDNFGLRCDDDCPNFGFNLEYCPIAAGSNIEILTFILTEDGETGGFARSDNCIFTLHFPIKINSAGLQIPDLNPIVCRDSSIILDAGIGCDKYLWSTGDTTSAIEVSPQFDSQYGVTVTASTGCEIIDTIHVVVENCCAAQSGGFMPNSDTLIICPFESPEIVVSNTQTSPDYLNVMLVSKEDSIMQIYLDTLLVFNPPQYQFEQIEQCDTLVIYTLNIHTPTDNTLPEIGSSISDFDHDCFEIDSLIIIIQDDTPPLSDYPFQDSLISNENNIIIRSYDTISCISELQDAFDLSWIDGCALQETSFVVNDNLAPCELSYFGRLWSATDYCNNTTLIRNWTTLIPDTLIFDVLATNEYCAGANNGQLDIVNINQPDALWSIDNGPLSSETHYENLAPGQHIIDGVNACGCMFSDTAFIDPGIALNMMLVDTICNDNGTLGIPEDDFYSVSIIVSATSSISDSCSLYQNGIYIGNIKYDEIYVFTIDANAISSMIQAFDLLKPECEAFIDLELPGPCSGICQLNALIQSEECNDNDTRGNNFDDFYELLIQVIPENTNSDSFRVLIGGTETYRLPYLSDHTIVLPADGSEQQVTIQDLQIDSCDTTLTTNALIPCSGTCQILIELIDIVCDDNDTRSDPSDDTWSFSVTGSLIDGSGDIRYSSALNSGFFADGDTITVEDIAIDIPALKLNFRDSVLIDCDTMLTILAPDACSNCLQDIEILVENENCTSNDDGAIWVALDRDSLISITVEETIYENGARTLASGDHLISIIYGDSCRMDTVINVGLRPMFDLELTDAHVIQHPDVLELEAMTDLDFSEILEIIWRPENDLSCTDCLTPTFSGDTTTSYVVSVEDINGCIAYDSTVIEVTRIPEIFFPNVIRPQSRINNRIFPIANDNNLHIQRMEIFDRWGNLVFQNHDFKPNMPEQGWDGTFNGQEVVNSVFIYSCTYRTAEGREERIIGAVTVLE